MTKNALLLVLLLSTTSLFAQDEMTTDRPDQSDGTNIIKCKELQFESEVYLNTYKTHRSSIISSSLLRYGVGSNIELRIVAEQGLRRDVFIDETVQGVYPLATGFKAQLMEENDQVPSIAVLGQVNVPVTNRKGVRDYWSPMAMLLVEKKIRHFNITANSGMKQNAFDNSWSAPFSVDVKYELSGNVEVFSEYFAQYARHELPDHNADAGVVVHLNKDLMWFSAVGAKLFANEHNYFANSGIAIHLN